MNVTAHVAQNTARRRSAIDERTTRHPGYGMSQHIRKRIEEGFGWSKEFGLLRRIRVRGRERISRHFRFSEQAGQAYEVAGRGREAAARLAGRVRSSASPARPESYAEVYVRI